MSYPKKNLELPSPDRLGRLLAGAGVELSREQLNQLWRYHSILRARNQDRDLTRLVGFETIVQRHYIDCLIVGKFYRLPTPLLDIGTGAGFPGIPLKIRYPNLHIVLAEPRPKRIAFLQEVVASLKLSRIELFEHKVVSRSFKKQVKGVITRAVETMDKTFLRSSGATHPGSHLIFMKGPNVGQELQSFEERFGFFVRKIVDRSYCLPHSQLHRRLIVFEITRSFKDHGDQHAT